jgi:predicted pyridoxine 5'-phosphate oxidase superfamily flavin-nucleotide-binding protein
MSRGKPSSPWHAGERAMQARLGVAERMAEIGPRLIHDSMPDPHREFFAQLPFVILGSIDDHDEVWASLLTGPPGFMRSPDPGTLTITAEHGGIPGLAPGRAIGLLGIEPHTRRRNRMSGSLVSVTTDVLRIAVAQSFGNCPKYIYPRELVEAEASSTRPVERFEGLDARARAIIATADTMFVASYAEVDMTRQVDVSHRGGPAGFVKLDAAGTLTIPDYAGNRFFNTLGNISLQPRVGLLFIDFERGDLLQIVGTARLLPDGDARLARLAGAERAWTLQPRSGVHGCSRLRVKCGPTDTEIFC